MSGYDDQVRARMAVLRQERPAESNWIGYVNAEHPPGECVECDALRKLEDEDDPSDVIAITLSRDEAEALLVAVEVRNREAKWGTSVTAAAGGRAEQKLSDALREA